MSKNKGKHLTYDDRLLIQRAIENGATKKAIGDLLGRPISSIAYEIKKRRIHVYIGRKRYACKHLKTCRPGICYGCDMFEQATCNRRDRSPGACNGCDTKDICRLDKFDYKALEAEKAYRYDLSDSRIGVDLTTSQAQAIADVVKPYIDRGISPYVIIKENPQLNISEKTLYNYIEAGVLPNIGNIDLSRKVSYKQRKNPQKRRSKAERAYLIGREYEDFLNYIEKHDIENIVLMDTVEGIKGGKVITTLHFVQAKLTIGILQENKKSIHPVIMFDKLTKELGLERFKKLFPVILTDRGSEFVQADEIENYIIKDEAVSRTKIFYCDPQQAWQKAALEKAHSDLRIYLPKGSSFNKLNQNDLNEIFSQIANYPVESLNGKTAYEAYSFFFSNTDLECFKIKKLNLENINRKPYKKK